MSSFLFYTGNTLCKHHQLAVYKTASVEIHDNQTIGVFVPRCNPDGHYTDRQCMDTLGLCWCVDNYGNEIPGTRIRGIPNCQRIRSKNLS